MMTKGIKKNKSTSKKTELPLPNAESINLTSSDLSVNLEEIEKLLVIKKILDIEKIDPEKKQKLLIAYDYGLNRANATMRGEIFSEYKFMTNEKKSPDELKVQSIIYQQKIKNKEKMIDPNLEFVKKITNCKTDEKIKYFLKIYKTAISSAKSRLRNKKNTDTISYIKKSMQSKYSIDSLEYKVYDFAYNKTLIEFEKESADMLAIENCLNLGCTDEIIILTCMSSVRDKLDELKAFYIQGQESIKKTLSHQGLALHRMEKEFVEQEIHKYEAYRLGYLVAKTKRKSNTQAPKEPLLPIESQVPFKADTAEISFIEPNLVIPVTSNEASDSAYHTTWSFELSSSANIQACFPLSEPESPVNPNWLNDDDRDSINIDLLFN